MELKDADIRQLAAMMKLNLTDQEVEKFRDEMSSILDFVSKLKEVDVTGVPEVGQVSGEQNNWGKDELIEAQATKDELLDAAPERKEDFVKVPGVFKHD